MSDLPVVRPRQLIRALERAGFFVHHIRGSHHYLRQAGLTPDDLRSLL